MQNYIYKKIYAWRQLLLQSVSVQNLWNVGLNFEWEKTVGEPIFDGANFDKMFIIGGD